MSSTDGTDGTEGVDSTDGTEGVDGTDGVGGTPGTDGTRATDGAHETQATDATGPDGSGPEGTGPDGTGPDATGPDGSGPAEAAASTASGAYFARLAELMRERGVPQARIATLTRELSAFADEAGGEVAEEFGPVEELAEQLSERESSGLTEAPDGTAGPAAPGDGAETWVWTADAFKDVRLLEHFGGQGWEVERLDRLGRFVCRRDAGDPMRWEYRRETAGRARRAVRTGELRPEGWEECGVWGPFTYYKRPAAVLDGPAARLSEAPAPPARRVYIGKGVYGWIGVCVLAVVVAAWSGALEADFTDLGTLAGLCVGMAVGGGAAWGLWRSVQGTRTPDGDS
ncbi:hypothetical protein [Streptomyces sp. HNM0575]|uniref:hypothetical protein n=1 Tax=Streptomyces sp. HNM0575 TaxID=2716338 RepID=UPI001F0F3518|nr:hypothetical protein [Streptomyces sp. HNM0575]